VAKSNREIVDELDDLLRKSGKPAGTILWSDFYELCELERWRATGPRPQEIKDLARAQYSLIVEFGDQIVLVAHDRNFESLIKKL
jgi:hypothetical protein